MYKILSIPPQSCDTFAVLPPNTLNDCVIFGKNSDRPSDEVQEVIYVPAADHPLSSTVRCTYIDVNQVPHTYSVVLSKPSWMWGAEMGANEHGVCIGNEAVWTKIMDSSDNIESLLGMDLLRLALERSKTAVDALKVITCLIGEYGMGGNCSDTLPNFTYHNSFLIADPSEIWILECAGTIWAAEQVREGVRNISNELSIRTNIDRKCDMLETFAEDKGLWDRSTPLDFKKVFDTDEYDGPRYKEGRNLLTLFSEGGQFKVTDMFKVLRDHPSGICMSSGSFVTTGSQVSILRKPESGLPSVHWFTATPDPARSIYKPFIFTENICFPDSVVSPVSNTTSSSFDRRYHLYKLHEKYRRKRGNRSALRDELQKLETKYVDLAEHISQNFVQKKEEASKLFYDAVEEESSMYSDI
ncbi:secernin-3 [Trichonephila inaurata madagascariensis]|uniref:Secernin-3 n=1 Tax=Trichonephila inaurata madagascariensis TaxID=2747483 RepID=A0A8X6YRE6_9ARAC|nr:secernin-3 [Trichonephila inaurata madagascariensis]